MKMATRAAEEGPPLVSVVTPVHNGRTYLAECIESVLAQDYERWDYVILDNRSTDGSRELAESYAARDARIRVLAPTEFLPIVPNWNRAMRAISPESRYVKMVAADDFLFPECLSKMVEVAEAHPSVGIVGAYRIHGDRVDLDALPYWETVVPGRELGRRSLLGGRYVFGSSTSVLYRADLVRARTGFFDEMNFNCDEDAAYNILRTTDFGFVHQVLTFTRLHDGALTSSYMHPIDTWTATHLNTILKYGPAFLSEPEFRGLVRKNVRRYELLLIKKTLKLPALRDAGFRDYHAQAMMRLEELFAQRGLRPGPVFSLLRLLLFSPFPARRPAGAGP